MTALRDSSTMAVQVAETLKALGHPLRIRLIALLVEGDVSVGDLATALEVKPAIVSQQLRILRMVGLVTSHRRQGRALYTLAEPGLTDLIACIEGCDCSRREVPGIKL